MPFPSRGQQHTPSRLFLGESIVAKPALDLKTKKRQQMVFKKKEAGSYFLEQTGTEFISTGCTLLDMVLGGGWALARIANIVGDKSTGKTLAAIEACCNFILKFPNIGKIRYVEPEAAFDQSYAAALGLPIDRVDFAEDDSIHTVEDFYADLNAFLDSLEDGEPGLYILDSLDALSSDEEMKREFSDKSYSMEKQKKMGELFRKLNQKIKAKRVLVLIVSQVRDNIGVAFGEKLRRSGGKALDFFASQILWFSQTGTMKKVIRGLTRTTGVQIKAKCKKNKVGLPFRECAFDILFGYGIDDLAANLRWLGTIGKLHYYQPGLEPKNITRALSQLEDHGVQSISGFKEKASAAVKKAWPEIEKDFLPKTRKY